jgi:hypothetical protein
MRSDVVSLRPRNGFKLTVFETDRQRKSSRGYVHGSGLAGGVYFYLMQAGDFIQSQELVILK